MTDDELMTEIAKGSERAFTTLFRRHSGKVLGYARGLVGSTALAEDVSQDVWIKVVKMAPSYQTQNMFSAWIMTITRNTSLDLLRHRSKDVVLDDDKAESIEDVSRQSVLEVLAGESELSLVRAAIAALPENQRTCLTLWMSEEISYEEIAKQLGLSVASVKSLLFRARTSLAERLRGDA